MVVFLGALLIGLPLGAAGAIPATEVGVLASVLLLGAALVLLLRPPVAASLLLVALFGLVHGHAHGAELSPGADLTYMAGLLVSTALLVASAMQSDGCYTTGNRQPSSAMLVQHCS